jgi:hypothetical protein
MFGGGCVVIVFLGFIGLLVAGGLFWDRGTEAGTNFASNWVAEQFGSDISDRADAVTEVSSDLPEAREFNDRDSYLEFLDSYHREFATTMESVAELLRNPQIQNEEWQDDMAQQIAVIRHLDAEAREVTPPPDLEDAHDNWVNGMGEYRRAVDTTASAVDNVSPSQLVEAIGALNSATQFYVETARSLDDIGALDELETLENLQEIEESP